MACASCHSSPAHHTAALRCMHFLGHVRAGWMATFHWNFASETYIAPSIFRTTCDAGLHLAMYLRQNSCICMCELLPLRMAPLRLTACVVLACTLMHAPCMAAARGHLCHTSHAQQDWYRCAMVPVCMLGAMVPVCMLSAMVLVCMLSAMALV